MRLNMGLLHEGQSFMPCFSWSSLHILQTTWCAQGRKTTDISSERHITHSLSRFTPPAAETSRNPFVIPDLYVSQDSFASGALWASVSLLGWLPSMPLFRAAIFDESLFSLNWEISFSSFWISSLYFWKFASALIFMASSFDFADASSCSLSFLIEFAWASNSSFVFSSCFHRACKNFRLDYQNSESKRKIWIP